MPSCKQWVVWQETSLSAQRWLLNPVHYLNETKGKGKEKAFFIGNQKNSLELFQKSTTLGPHLSHPFARTCGNQIQTNSIWQWYDSDWREFSFFLKKIGN